MGPCVAVWGVAVEGDWLNDFYLFVNMGRSGSSFCILSYEGCRDKVRVDMPLRGINTGENASEM